MKKRFIASLIVITVFLSMAGLTASAAPTPKTKVFTNGEGTLSHSVYDKVDGGDVTYNVSLPGYREFFIQLYCDGDPAYFAIAESIGIFDFVLDEASMMDLSVGIHELSFYYMVPSRASSEWCIIEFEVIDSRPQETIPPPKGNEGGENTPGGNGPDGEDDEWIRYNVGTNDRGDVNAVRGGDGVTTPVQLPDYYVFSPGENVTWVPYPSGGRWMFQPSYIDGTFTDGSTATFTALKPGVTFATYFSLEYEKKTIPIYILES